MKHSTINNAQESQYLSWETLTRKKTQPTILKIIVFRKPSTIQQ